MRTLVQVAQAAPAFWSQYQEERRRQVQHPAFRPNPWKWPDTGLHAAWIGHSTVLLKIDGYTVLTDPVFSLRAGLSVGVTTLGVKRLVAPALDILDLPKIDLILLSHAHMDHFDLPSLRRLQSRETAIITAARTTDLLRTRRWGSVTEIGWGQQHRVGPATVRGVEVNHWGARMRSDRYRGYNGYVLHIGRYSVLFAGDTADTRKLQGVGGNRLDLAIMPIGAYNPWLRFHCTPEQAWRMVNEARADRILPVHHSTFRLSREPVHEPIARLQDAAGMAQDRIALREIGEEGALS